MDQPGGLGPEGALRESTDEVEAREPAHGHNPGVLIMLNPTKLPTSKKHQIGSPVRLKVQESPDIFVEGYIRAITFTNSKVRFSIYLKSLQSTFHNIDSVLVEESKSNEKRMDFSHDNYS